ALLDSMWEMGGGKETFSREGQRSGHFNGERRDFGARARPTYVRGCSTVSACTGRLRIVHSRTLPCKLLLRKSRWETRFVALKCYFPVSWEISSPHPLPHPLRAERRGIMRRFLGKTLSTLG